MRKLRNVFVLVFLFGFVVFTGAVEDESANKYASSKKSNYQIVLARVGDEEITSEQLYREMFRLYGKEVLSKMIKDAVVEQEAKSRDIEILPGEIDKDVEKIKGQFDSQTSFENFLKNQKTNLELLKRQIKINLLKRKMIVKDKNIKIGKEEIKEFFEKNKEKFNTPLQLKISHILVSSEEEAKDVYIALQAGADFAKMAKAKSIDAATSSKGGLLGVFSKGMLIPEFEEKIFSMAVGEISKPFKTRLGWHIVKVDEKIRPKEAKLDKDLKKRIKELLVTQKINQKYSDWISKLEKKWVSNLSK